MAAPQLSLWESKRRVEADNPDFPHYDVLSPDFDLMKYGSRVQQLLRDTGIPLDPFNVTWNNLTCSVPVEPPQLAIATVVSGLRSIASSVNNGFASLLPSHEKKPAPLPADVLHDVTGYVKPGEMCLVLGQSGSGTSLLLERIAGRELPKLVHGSGSVLYQGEERLAGVARTTNIAHFIGQDDVHIPELTVRHTLEFAAECRWPEWVPFVDILRRNDVVMAARILGIERTLETIVGNNVLRGVSGGERKRVTIAEMAIGLVGGCLVMDNWSKGLDSATTLSITTSMRGFADRLKGSVVVSMQAPGTEVYNLFDSLCVLHEGRTVYFGPVSQAEAYFTNLGFNRPLHRTIPDFVSTVVDPQFRSEYVQPSTSQKAKPPETAEEFATCYEKSEMYNVVNNTMEKLNQQPKMTLPPGSDEIIKMGQRKSLQWPRHQIQAMMRRQKNFLLSTRKSVFQELFQNIIFGLVIGSIFWQLPNNQSGAGSRDGVIFLALLFIGLGALAKIEDRFAEKGVFMKQNKAGFYEAWTYLLTQACFDFLLELLKAITLFVPLYLMAGLNIGSSAQRLLFAILVGTFTSLTLVSMTRTFAAIMDDAAAAQGLAGLSTIFMVLFAGYMKNGSELEGWLVWIYWIDPIHYGLEALLINEFDGITLRCDPGELIPASPDIPDALKDCPYKTGKKYLNIVRGIDLDNMYRLYFFLVLVAFCVLFFVISAFATTFSNPKGFARKSEYVQTEKDEGVPVKIAPEKEDERTTFTFRDIKYTVDNGNKVLLPGVTGSTVSGQVVLLVGTSGAGKSTLLDVCAMRKTLSKGTSMEGEIKINGRVVAKKELSHTTGYCEQNDMHIGEATVYEAVLFSAKLRLPKSIALEEKRSLTMETLSLLGLERFSSVLVKALGAGELKLLTMALEVVADPKVLFLDEPTSGLNSSSAIVVAKAIRKIADAGTAVICTLHQPSAEVFAKFDRVLVLKRGGRTVYFGDIGENATVLRGYFESNGGQAMKPDENPASWMLDVVGDTSVDWAEVWEQSNERLARSKETERLSNNACTSSSSDVMTPPPPSDEHYEFDGPSKRTQIDEVIRRQFWTYWRKPSYNGTRVMLNFMIALLVGLLFLREVDNSQRGANLAFAALFLSIIPAALAATNVIPTTMESRDVFYRETASGTYKSIAYHVAVGIVELPFTIFSTTVFAVVFYFMVGLDPSRFLYFFLAIQLLYLMAVNFGIMLAAIFPTIPIAANAENSLFSTFQVLSGFFILKPNLPVWWRWTTWINPFNYYLSGVVFNQFDGQQFTCDGSEQFVDKPAQFARCTDIPPGVFNNSTNPDKCAYCAIPNGNAMIERFGAGDVNKWVGLAAIFAVILFFRVVAAYGFTRKRFITR